MEAKCLHYAYKCTINENPTQYAMKDLEGDWTPFDKWLVWEKAPF